LLCVPTLWQRNIRRAPTNAHEERSTGRLPFEERERDGEGTMALPWAIHFDVCVCVCVYCVRYANATVATLECRPVNVKSVTRLKNARLAEPPGMIAARSRAVPHTPTDIHRGQRSMGQKKGGETEKQETNKKHDNNVRIPIRIRRTPPLPSEKKRCSFGEALLLFSPLIRPISVNAVFQAFKIS